MAALARTDTVARRLVFLSLGPMILGDAGLVGMAWACILRVLCFLFLFMKLMFPFIVLCFLFPFIALFPFTVPLHYSHSSPVFIHFSHSLFPFVVPCFRFPFMKQRISESYSDSPFRFRTPRPRWGGGRQRQRPWSLSPRQRQRVETEGRRRRQSPMRVVTQE